MNFSGNKISYKRKILENYRLKQKFNAQVDFFWRNLKHQVYDENR